MGRKLGVKNVVKRLQVEFTESAYEDLNFLVDRLGSMSKVEALRDSVKVFRWIVSEVSAGNSLFIKREDGRLIEVVLPVLMNGRSIDGK